MSKTFLFILVFYAASMFSVNAQMLFPSDGKVEIVQDERITQLSGHYLKVSQKNNSIDGYRIQIFFDSGSNSKKKASEIRDEFQLNYSGVKAYLSYKEPYYRVRVGDFRTLIEAVGFQKKIGGNYPNSFPVKDKISL